MSVRDLQEALQEVFDDWGEIEKSLTEFNKLTQETKITQEQYARVVENIAPEKQWVEFCMQIKYLLDLPNRKSKQEKYNKQNHKTVETLEKQGHTTKQLHQQFLETAVSSKQLNDEIVEEVRKEEEGE